MTQKQYDCYTETIYVFFEVELLLKYIGSTYKINGTVIIINWIYIILLLDTIKIRRENSENLHTIEKWLFI
jgi:hypothetical protein